MRLSRCLIFFLVLLTIGCATSSRSLLKDRYLKLQNLSRFQARTCDIETALSEPVKIKYLQLYPAEHALIQESNWTYKWTVQEGRCEISSSRKSNLLKSHRAILNAAFCTLLQVHWVNSPFDGMLLESDQIDDRKDLVFLQQGPADLGVSIYKKDFLIETNTKKLGTLRAHYNRVKNSWLPDWLEQRFHSSVVRVDQINYTSPESARSMLESFWIAVGENEPMSHTSVKIQKCY